MNIKERFVLTVGLQSTDLSEDVGVYVHGVP